MVRNRETSEGSCAQHWLKYVAAARKISASSKLEGERCLLFTDGVVMAADWHFDNTAHQWKYRAMLVMPPMIDVPGCAKHSDPDHQPYLFDAHPTRLDKG